MTCWLAAAIEEQGAATSKIARNVAQTSSAAQAVASRIPEVSSEATNTGERAAQVNALSSTVAHSIDQLRHVLVQAVRTAAPEVNRRRAPRYVLNCPATLTAAGRDRVVTVENASEGGVQLSGAIDDLTAGMAVQLAIQGLAQRVSGTVKSVEAGHTHLNFVPSSDFAQAFRSMVDGLKPMDQVA